jgi:mannose-6-phosphate isomerase-like protein (cupin superfamily)
MLAHMSTTPQSLHPTAQGQPRWFFGSLMTIKASAADTGGGYTMLDCTWPADVGTPLHVHYEEDEGFYVLEGSVSITVGDDVVELKAGEHAFGPRGVPHRFDVGPEGARMVWVLTPGGFEDFVEEASVPAEALTTAPPEILPPADIEAIVRRHGMELL